MDKKTPQLTFLLPQMLPLFVHHARIEPIETDLRGLLNLRNENLGVIYTRQQISNTHNNMNFKILKHNFADGYKTSSNRFNQLIAYVQKIRYYPTTF